MRSQPENLLTASQEGGLLQALGSPAAYPHPAARVRMIETHISHVFLAGRYVYKIKKPVNFGFLDYSTLELRRHFCEEEVRLNQRLCPDIYLGVLPIAAAEPDGVQVGGAGKPLEWAVIMRRLPAARMLDRLVRSGQVTEWMIERVADRVADFHASTNRGADIDAFGSLDVIRSNWRENFDQIQPYVGRTISDQQLLDIQDYVTRFAEIHARLFDERVVTGRIRDCHGDMRAESICITNGICIHDCIEFNERFRYGDVASEVAFLTMDLDARGRPDLGYWFADRYNARTRDDGLRRLLPFYACYRAFVRGKVQSFRLDQPSRSARQRAQAASRARRYVRLAHAYTRMPNAPILVLVAGLPGTGKTSLARAMAARMAAVVHSSDYVRKDLAGVPAGEHTQVPFEAGLYAPEMSRRTYARLIELARDGLAAGDTVIVDATFRRRSDRQPLYELAQDMKVSCWVVECESPESVVKARLEQRVAMREGASDADWTVFLNQRESFEKVTADEPACRLAIDTSGPLVKVLTRTLEGVLSSSSGGGGAG